MFHKCFSKKKKPILSAFFGLLVIEKLLEWFLIFQTFFWSISESIWSFRYFASMLFWATRVFKVNDSTHYSTDPFVAKINLSPLQSSYNWINIRNCKYIAIKQFQTTHWKNPIAQTNCNRSRVIRSALLKRDWRLSFSGALIAEKSWREYLRGEFHSPVRSFLFPSSFFFFSFFERDRRSQKRVARNRLKPRSIYPLDTFSLFSRVCDIAFIRRVATPSYTPPYHQFLNYHGRTDDDTVVANAPWSSFHSSRITTSISLHPNEPTSSFLSSPCGKRAFFCKRKWHFLRYGTFRKIIIFDVRNCWFLK